LPKLVGQLFASMYDLWIDIPVDYVNHIWFLYF